MTQKNTPEEWENSDRYIPKINEDDYSEEKLKEGMQRHKMAREIIFKKYDNHPPEGWGLITACMFEFVQAVQSPTPTDAVEFIRWIIKKDYIEGGKNQQDMWFEESGECVAESTESLYQIFKEEKEKQKSTT